MPPTDKQVGMLSYLIRRHKDSLPPEWIHEGPYYEADYRLDNFAKWCMKHLDISSASRIIRDFTIDDDRGLRSLEETGFPLQYPV